LVFTCAQCSINCNGHGHCDDGIDGTGSCICNSNQYDPNENCLLFANNGGTSNNAGAIYGSISAAVVIIGLIGFYIWRKQKQHKQELETVLSVMSQSASEFNNLHSTNGTNFSLGGEGFNTITRESDFRPREPSQLQHGQIEDLSFRSKRNIIVEDSDSSQKL